MSLDPATIAHRWFDEVWNHGSEQGIDELMSEATVGHGLGEGENDVHGPSDFRTFWRNLRGALPDIHIAIEDTLVQDDKVVVRLRLTGTHRGDGLGVPASGGKVAISGIVILKTGNSRIVEAWNSWDQLGLLKQIGAIPGARTEDRFLSAKA